MVYSNIVATIAIIVSVIAVPASGYLSYHYAVKGEKRKEFNNIADKIRNKLQEQKILLAKNHYPALGHLEISKAEFYMLMDVSNLPTQKKLIQSWEAYQNSLSSAGEFDEDGYYSMHDANSVIKTIDSLLQFLKRK